MDVLQGSGAPGHPTRGSPEGAQGGSNPHPWHWKAKP